MTKNTLYFCSPNNHPSETIDGLDIVHELPLLQEFEHYSSSGPSPAPPTPRYPRYPSFQHAYLITTTCPNLAQASAPRAAIGSSLGAATTADGVAVSPSDEALHFYRAHLEGV